MHIYTILLYTIHALFPSAVEKCFWIPPRRRFPPHGVCVWKGAASTPPAAQRLFWTLQGLLVNQDTHRPWGGPMPLGRDLP